MSGGRVGGSLRGAGRRKHRLSKLQLRRVAVAPTGAFHTWHPSTKSGSDSDCNAAMLSYFLTPLRVGASGNVEIVSGRTTAKPSAAVDFRYSFWGVMLADDYMRDDLRATLGQVIMGKTLKTGSPPRTTKAISPTASKLPWPREWKNTIHSTFSIAATT